MLGVAKAQNSTPLANHSGMQGGCENGLRIAPTLANHNHNLANNTPTPHPFAPSDCGQNVAHLCPLK
jgi:hypothetical protein